jgi:lipoprotein-releasing system ATP-binding protein
MTAIVQTTGLVRRIEGAVIATLVSRIDLAVEKGEFLAITGPSGCGKSSLLYLLGLLDTPTEGEIYIAGQPTSLLSESQKAALRLRMLGFVFQFHFLLPEFSALQNVLMPMRTLDRLPLKDMRARGVELLTSLGLGGQIAKLPNQMSGGQRQRVAIARALANDPEIIMADEPTGALDSASTEQVFSILRDLADKGRTVVVVTHDMALAERADRRVRMVDGKIADITVSMRPASSLASNFAASGVGVGSSDTSSATERSHHHA